MKRHTRLLSLAFLTAGLYALGACGGGHDHAGGGDDHDHDRGGDAQPAGKAGPNGGRILHGVEPHAEFLILEDRKVQIAFVDDDLKAIPVENQVVSVFAGDRSNPTTLAFARQGDVLVSDTALPAGNDFPVVVQIKTTPEAEAVIEKFNANLEKCPTCKFQEYACICEHADGDDHGHDHENK